MYFHSFAEFLAMGGKGFFVWSAYGISAVLIVGSMVVAARGPGRVRRDIARSLQRQRRFEAHGEQRRFEADGEQRRSERASGEQQP